MIRSIAVLECYNNLISSRFLIGFLLCLLLIPFSTVIGIQEFQGRQNVYQVEKQQADESTQALVWSEYRPEVVKPPEPLSIFSKGISGTVGNQVKVYLSEIPMLASGRVSARDNPFLNSIFTLDFTSMIAILMSLLALIFSYDVCTGEKEAGTLKLVLSHTVSRSAVLAGKGLGILMTLIPIVVFCFILSAIIILVYPGVSFSASDWIRVSLLTVASIVYFMVFMALGMFVSSRSRSSVTSIVICLFIWVIFVFIVPSGAVYIARSFVSVRSQENLMTSLDEIDREANVHMEQEVDTLSRDGMWFMHFGQSGGYDGYQRLRGAERNVYEYYRQQHEIQEPIRIEYADRKWPLQQMYLDELQHQAGTAHMIGMISPVHVFKQVADALCRTDLRTHNSFMTSARRYREAVLDYFDEKKAYSSYLWFTSLDPATFLSADELAALVTEGQFQSLAEYREWAAASDDPFSVFTYSDPVWWDDSGPIIETSDAPVFDWKKDSINASLGKTAGNLSAMICIVLILFFLSFVSFTRFDVR